MGAQLSSPSETETAISCATHGGAAGRDVWEDELVPLAGDNRDDKVLGTLANVGRLTLVLFELQDLFLELDLEEVEPALDTSVTGVLPPPFLGRRGGRPGGRDDSPAGHASDPGENDFEETNAASSVSSESSEESLLLSMARTRLKRKEQKCSL